MLEYRLHEVTSVEHTLTYISLSKIHFLKSTLCEHSFLHLLLDKRTKVQNTSCKGHLKKESRTMTPLDALEPAVRELDMLHACLRSLRETQVTSREGTIDELDIREIGF